MKKTENKKVGPIMMTLIVLIVIITASLYAFASHINKQSSLNSKNTFNTNSADDVQTLKNDLNNVIK